MRQDRIGLVLEGGAMRGLFTAGVLDVWMENRIRFDAAIGVSAGAVFGCNYKSRQPGRVLRYNVNYCRDPRYCGLRSLIRTGDLFGADFCYRELPEVLDPFNARTYDANPLVFYVVCTDTETGKAVYRRCDRADEETFTWFRASASMPFVSKPVFIGGRQYLDGGIADPIPLAFFLKQGIRRNIVILTRPRDYVKKQAGGKNLLRFALRKHPKLIPAVRNRHKVYAESRKLTFSEEAEGRAFVVCPASPLSIGRISHDPDEIRKAYDAGREAALQSLPELEAFLEEKNI